MSIVADSIRDIFIETTPNDVINYGNTIDIFVSMIFQQKKNSEIKVKQKFNTKFIDKYLNFQ